MHAGCPRCGSGLILRAGRRGFFWGCTGYPGCKWFGELSEQENDRLGMIFASLPGWGKRDLPEIERRLRVPL